MWVEEAEKVKRICHPAIAITFLVAAWGTALAGFSETEVPLRTAVRYAKVIAVGRIAKVETFKYPTTDGLGHPRTSTGYIFTLRVTETLKGNAKLKTATFFDRLKCYKRDQKVIVFLSPVNAQRTRIPKEIPKRITWEYVSSGNRYTVTGPDVDALIAYTKELVKLRAAVKEPPAKLVLSIEKVNLRRKGKNSVLLLTVRFTNKSKEDIALSDAEGIGLTVVNNKKHVTWHSRPGNPPTTGSFSVLRPGQSLDRKVRFDDVMFEKGTPHVEAYYHFHIHSHNCGMLVTEPNPWCGLVRSRTVDISKALKGATWRPGRRALRTPGSGAARPVPPPPRGRS